MAIARPYKDVYLHIRIDTKTKVKFENICNKRNEVPAETVRRLIREYIEGDKK